MLPDKKMTKTLNSPLIIHSSNHGTEWSLYLVAEGVCALENMLSYFLGSLVFQIEEINCMACWWASEKNGLFVLIQTKAPARSRATENSLLHRKLLKYLSYPHRPPSVDVFIFGCWSRLKVLVFSLNFSCANTNPLRLEAFTGISKRLSVLRKPE